MCHLHELLNLLMQVFCLSRMTTSKTWRTTCGLMKVSKKKMIASTEERSIFLKTLVDGYAVSFEVAEAMFDDFNYLNGQLH